MPRLLVAPKGGRETASSRYRVHDLLPALADRGWDAFVLTPSVARERRARAFARDLRRAVRGSDVLLLQRPGRRREESLLLRVAAAQARVVAIDVDDPVDDRGLSAWALRRADLAFVGSGALASRYEGRVSDVVFAPTAIDVEAYALPRAPGDVPVIGWIGDGPAYADPLVRMIGFVASCHGGWRLRVVGTKGDRELERGLRKAAASLPLELLAEIDWQSEAVVARTVAAFDVGLVPFRNSEGASFKTIQYLAAGSVPIVEAGGEGERHARAALGADAPIVPPASASALAAVLDRLADPAIRRRLACLGQERARRLFSHAAVAETIDAALRRALEADLR